MSGKRNVLVAILLVLVAGGIYIYKEFNRSNANIVAEASIFRISAEELIKDFKDNDSLANRKYAGKVIVIEGIAKDISEDDIGYYTLVLGDSTSMSSVRCSVDSMYSAGAASVKPGMKIKVKGICTGYHKDDLLGLDVIVNRCYIENKK